MFNYGTQWKGPYTIKAATGMPLNLEMDLLTAPLKNEWSVIVWAEKSAVKITHSDNFASDAWPVQTPFSSGTIVNPTPTPEPTPNPTPDPTPVPTQNALDTFVTT
jgi:hypothetical protein